MSDGRNRPSPFQYESPPPPVGFKTNSIKAPCGNPVVCSVQPSIEISVIRLVEWHAVVGEDLGFDGGGESLVLTPIERLRIVARPGIERTKSVRAQLASKRKHVN